MENTKIIQDFLDGKLDESGEDTFFNEVASNKESREVFKSYLAIELALKNDSKTFIPPLSTTTGLLTRLGFAIPGAIAGGAAVTGLGKFEFLRNFTQGIYSALVSAAVTAVAILGYIHVTDSNKETETKIINKSEAVSNQISPIPDKSAQTPVNTQLNNQGMNNLAQSQKPIIKYVYITKKESISSDKNNTPLINDDKSGSLNNEVIKNDVAVLNEKNKNEQIISNDDQSLNKKVNNFEKSSLFTSPLNNENIRFNQENNFPRLKGNNENYTFGNFNIFKNSGLGIEIRGLQDWSLKDPAVKESSVPKFNNMGLSLTYKVTDNFSIAFDGRQEYFYQEYNGIDESGNTNLYQQFPSFLSLGLGLKYNFLNYENVSAFGQATFGGNEAGLIGRTMIGIEFLPKNFYTFFIGLEASMMNYYHKDNRFQTSKIGLNYGIKFNL
jgi:hypothetical protein